MEPNARHPAGLACTDQYGQALLAETGVRAATTSTLGQVVARSGTGPKARASTRTPVLLNLGCAKRTSRRCTWSANECGHRANTRAMAVRDVCRGRYRSGRDRRATRGAPGKRARVAV